MSLKDMSDAERELRGIMAQSDSDSDDAGGGAGGAGGGGGGGGGETQRRKGGSFIGPALPANVAPPTPSPSPVSARRRQIDCC